jgi:uncharacterized membrane protein
MPPIKHIHPILVHFPIVFFLSLAALDLAATARGHIVTGRGALGNLSSGLSILAGAFGLAAFIFGGIALDVAESTGFHSDIAEIHEGIGTFTATAFAVWALFRSLLWWRDVRISRAFSGVISLVEIAGAILVIVTAYYGGQLVYVLGVNVAHSAT